MQPFRERATQKAFELSYAIFRVSSVMTSRTFADRLEHQALLLLEAATFENYASMKHSLQTIEYFIRLAADTNLVHGPHAEQIFQELVNLYRAIEAHEEKEVAPPVSLEGIFSSEPVQDNKSGNPTYETLQVPKAEALTDTARPVHRSQVFSASMRQSKILEKIRQSGKISDGQPGCRFKDLLEALPDSSERTLRYDLQDLIEQGLIERLGTGGPATYYQALPEKVVASDVGKAS
jgi:hypothetical protein